MNNNCPWVAMAICGKTKTKTKIDKVDTIHVNNNHPYLP